MKLKYFYIILIVLLSSSLNANTIDKLELKKDLRFLRNEIFARHGREFNSPDLKKYFNNKSWYSPRKEFKDSDLNNREQLATKTLLALENSFDLYTNRELEEVESIYNVIKYFYNTELDTTFILIGEFDGRPTKDTIKTHIHETNDNLELRYSFIRNDSEIWHTTFTNPYLWCGNIEPLVSIYDNIFGKIHMAIKAKAKIWPKSDSYPKMKEDWALSLGIGDLNAKGHIVDKNVYQAFLDQFDYDLLIHSMDESGGQLTLWYEPAKEFITFYAP